MTKLTGYKIKQVTNVIGSKLGIALGNGRERCGWYWLDGQKIIKVEIPHGHGSGKGDTLSPGVMKNLQNSLRLDRENFFRFLDCPMKGPEFEAKVRANPILYKGNPS